MPEAAVVQVLQLTDAYHLGLNLGEPRCKTRRHFHHPRSDYLSVTILVLAVFSTVFSAIWLGVALAKPRYGRYVTEHGHLAPSTASLLTAGFAKLIELSFVTVFVSVLGQILSRRAFVKQSRGVTIAEMQMRTWVMQPGTMITHRETVRYAGWTILGGIALVTALMAMLYTTASDALVQPKLKFGRLEKREMWGQVTSRFGYENFLEYNVCKTPISNLTDPSNGPTCMAIQYSGQAYHNYGQYLSSWSDAIKVHNGSVDETERPKPVGMLYDNTTVEGSWIEQMNMTQLSDQFGRVVNNVTMAMPLSAVFGAARDARNDILQPQDLQGLGEYFLEASVPSPSVNVLCASMTKAELAPMVVTLWPGFNTTNNGTAPNASNYPADYKMPFYPDWLNDTAVDDLFGFGKKYGRRMPIFPKVPLPFNTVLNETTPFNTDPKDENQVYLVDSIYVLATSNATSESPYMLCSIRASMSPNCSTEYHASMSGGSMTANCEVDNPMAYNISHPEATSGVWDPLWITAANTWAQTMSLDAGITDNNAANARLLTQLIPQENHLDPLLPSISEALAVLAGPALLAFSNTPFIHYWNYSTNSADSWYLEPPQYQAFNATLLSQDYSSGGSEHWQGIFYIVLFAIFFTNIFCLAYFIVHHGLVTDFIEPQNLFALSLNSPPSHVLEGSCGGGPEPEQLKTNWHIRLERDRDHFLIESKDEPPEVRLRRGKTRGSKSKTWIQQEQQPQQQHGSHSPVAAMYDKLSRKRASLL